MLTRAQTKLLEANSPSEIVRALDCQRVTEAEVRELRPDFYEMQNPARRRSACPTITRSAHSEPSAAMKSLMNIFPRTPTAAKSAEETLLKERAAQSETSLRRAVARFLRAKCQANEMAALEYLHARIDAHPEIREGVQLLALQSVGRLGAEGVKRLAEMSTRATGETEADTLGAALIPTAVADLILDLAAMTGIAESSLGVVTMPAGITKLPAKTANPVALCFQQNQQPDTLTPDATLTGQNLTETAVTIAVLLQISEELLADQSADATAAFILACAQAIAYRLDYCSFSGTGANDGTNGGMTGLFNAAGLTAVNANVGNATLGGLQRQDFLAAVTALAPAAIQRGVSFWLHPSFVPTLMTIAYGPSGQLLIKTPMENESGMWSLAGFPLWLTTAAPVATVPGSQVCVSGYGAAYQIGLRQELEISQSRDAYFDKNLRGVRVSRRGRCDLQSATFFSILSLAKA